MQGKVTMVVLVCAHCGRPRLTLARAPWGAMVVLCRSCKQMAPASVEGKEPLTEEEAAANGLPKGRTATTNGDQAPMFPDSTPGDAPSEPAPSEPAPSPEPAPSRRRRAPVD